MLEELVDKNDVTVLESINTTENSEVTETISTEVEYIDPQEEIEQIEETENIIASDEDNTQTNCLALTVRKDYNLVILKNIFTTTGKLSWKVIILSAILNLLNLIF